MNDAVLTYHTTTLTCGIAKFNYILSKKIKCDLFQIFDRASSKSRYPMISVRIGEFSEEDKRRLEEEIKSEERAWKKYDIFLHGYGNEALEKMLVRNAERVFVGNSNIALELRELRDDIKVVWCPGMNLGEVEYDDTVLKLFTFGMAHKLKADMYKRLKDILEAGNTSYSLFISTALHEGTAFDESFISVYEEIKEIFNSKCYFLGYLSDQAVYNRLKITDYFVSFFPDGYRANNTSVNYSLSLGLPTITNLDRFSPSECKHGVNILDINQMSSLDLDESDRVLMGKEARKLGYEVHGWERLANILVG